MENTRLTARDAIELSKMIVAAIQKAGTPVEGIQIVTKIVYRELRKAGYASEQLLEIANTILDCVILETKEGKE